MNEFWKRPANAAEIVKASSDVESFGRNLRDWQHELRKVTSRREFALRIAEPPPLLQNKINDHRQCDAYLAAYVEWLCELHGVAVPGWLSDPRRVAEKAWFDYPPLWRDSFVHAPAAFRRRGVFTRPDDVLKLRRGRPRVSAAEKRRKSAERQRRYRERVREKLARLKALQG
ncbi:MAG: hypothetical protein GVY36_05075 [Verrucomicrobia bacterium]|jgi:hypothetical protein|nr:hypothetical protein [Verrucomicrobiota bacterium]